MYTIFEKLHDMSSGLLRSIDASYSYPQFMSCVQQRVDELSDVRPGELVCVRTGRDLQYFIDLVAVWQTGAVAVPLSADINEQGQESILADTQPRALIGQDGVEYFAGPCLKRGDAVAVLFTSGTTGTPKGVVLSEAALVGNARSSRNCIEIGPRDCLFTNIPFQFTSMLSHFLVAAISGASLFVNEGRLLGRDFVERLKGSGATCMGGSPTQLLWIVRSEVDLPDKTRWLMSSGDFLPSAVIQELRERYPAVDILTFYGITEVGGRFCRLPPGDVDRKAGSVGFPIEGLSYRILDEQGQSVADGEVGEIYASGDFLFTEYLNRPDSTAAVLTDRGYKTGDLGYRDADGYLFHVGRNDDVFKAGGEKVSGLVIKDALLKTGLFADVQVMPKEEQLMGLVPIAFLVPKQDTDLKRGPLLRELRQTLPANYIPKRMFIVDAIPRTGSGKPLKEELRKLADQSEELREL